MTNIIIFRISDVYIYSIYIFVCIFTVLFMGIFFFLFVYVVEVSGFWYVEVKYRDIVLDVGVIGIKEEVNIYLLLLYIDYWLVFYIYFFIIVCVLVNSYFINLYGYCIWWL